MNRTAFLILTLVASASVPPAADCSGESWVIQGLVTDDQGNPVGDARVYVLVDRISQKEFERKGVRMRSFLADGRGRYAAPVTCGIEPDPCGKKPKHLTLGAEKQGFGSRMQTLRLRDLEVYEDSGHCVVEAPELRLPRGY